MFSVGTMLVIQLFIVVLLTVSSVYTITTVISTGTVCSNQINTYRLMVSFLKSNNSKVDVSNLCLFSQEVSDFYLQGGLQEISTSRVSHTAVRVYLWMGAATQANGNTVRASAISNSSENLSFYIRKQNCTMMFVYRKTMIFE